MSALLALLRRLLDANYLYAQNAQATYDWSLGQSVWALVLVLGALAAGLWARRAAVRGRSALIPRITLGACLAGLGLLVLRSLLPGALSARIWALAATALALIVPLAAWLAKLPWPLGLRLPARAVACALGPWDARLSLLWQIVWGLVHVAGLYTLGVDEKLGWWSAEFALAALLVAAFSQWRATGRTALRVELLTPLLLPYLASLLRRLALEGLYANIGPYPAFPYADPWSPWFDVRVLQIAGVASLVLATGAFVGRSLPRLHLQLAAGPALALFGLIWYGAVLAVHLGHGVSGSDPYCYLQMAIDLAERGTVLHDFPLAGPAGAMQLSLWPAVHIGYHLPTVGTQAATVWPIGWPVLLAPFYTLGGERAAFWAGPLCALLAAWLTWKLARALRPGASSTATWLMAGVAVFVTLTAPEGASRTLVPMADAAVQLLSVLTLLALVYARQRDRLGWSAVAGLAFALAFFVRHPQLPLGLAALPTFLAAPWPRARRWLHLAMFGGVALVGALPDLLYHWTVFGSPLTTESPEWFLLGLQHIPNSALLMLHDGGLRRIEFGYLLPLIVYGAWRQAHSPGSGQARTPTERSFAALLWAGFGGVLLFNLCYSALRLRDLISLFPWLGLWAGYGVAELWERAQTGATGQTARRLLVVLLVTVALAARTTWALNMPWFPWPWTFGHLSATERSGFSQLATLLPPDAVVGTGLNSGAVELYTSHQTVRPYVWTEAEFGQFVDWLAQQGRPFYLLDDSEEMAPLITHASSAYRLRRLGELPIPFFTLGGGRAYDRSATLYALEEKP